MAKKHEKSPKMAWIDPKITCFDHTCLNQKWPENAWYFDQTTPSKYHLLTKNLNFYPKPDISKKPPCIHTINIRQRSWHLKLRRCILKRADINSCWWPRSRLKRRNVRNISWEVSRHVSRKIDSINFILRIHHCWLCGGGVLLCSPPEAERPVLFHRFFHGLHVGLVGRKVGHFMGVSCLLVVASIDFSLWIYNLSMWTF